MKKILPIAIMAHNEERVINRAICSCLCQEPPLDFEVIIVVVANACVDATESIVENLSSFNSNIILLSTQKKGKTNALNLAINFISDLRNDGCDIPFIVFLDADCKFGGKECLIKYVENFNRCNRLLAVSSMCIPNINDMDKSLFVRILYASLINLSKSVPYNGIHGGSYIVKLNILHDNFFPNIQMADDVFMSARLDGWFCKDNEIIVLYEIPKNIFSEMNKRIRHEVANINFLNYQIYYKEKTGKNLSINDCVLDDKYRWYGFSRKDLIFAIKNILSFRDIIFVVFSLIMRKIALFKARRIARNISGNNECDFWIIER